MENNTGKRADGELGTDGWHCTTSTTIGGERERVYLKRTKILALKELFVEKLKKYE